MWWIADLIPDSYAVHTQFVFTEYDEAPFGDETQAGNDDIPTLNDILAASFVNVSNPIQ